ncbi:fasciclin domain-containing protein [Streptomyces sp. NPDC046831]|uniref:fasciclin domain-containing protein n=1 Tax=Streptomyces sp. NPDC046831 TaxID=3154805 RepID=UPI0033E48FAA
MGFTATRTAKAATATAIAIPLTLGGLTSQGHAQSPSPSPSGTFGPACSALNQKADTSKDRVTEAAAAYPQLSQLVSAVVRARLNGTLDRRPHITVFAPNNQAFQKVTVSQLNSLLGNREQLKEVLAYHVVDKQIAPGQLSNGSFKTVEGSTLTTSGSGTNFKVNGKASIVCGNIKVANATIYVIDSVLMPPS